MNAELGTDIHHAVGDIVARVAGVHERPKMPDYLSKVTLNAETDNLYCVSRFIGALANKCYGPRIQNV